MNTWDWAPISLSKIEDKIFDFELQATEELKNFWELIKIKPQKWQEPQLGQQGGGFWVVAISGKRILWYNDIEEGFNISEYKIFGEFDDYLPNQSNLNSSVKALFDFIKKPW